MTPTLQPLSAFPAQKRRAIRFVLTDIDDTLTIDGRLTASAYAAMDRLDRAGIVVVPVTGRPAGWCDLIARQWPVGGVVGENGAFYFRHDPARRSVVRRFWREPEQRRHDRGQLTTLGRRILAAVPGAQITSDQEYRESDLAIDWCEDVERLSQDEIDRIVALAHEAGATVKVSSIHVNIWFGEFNKLAMTRVLFREQFATEIDDAAEQFVFAGDSPNDAPMFAFFPFATGVANVLDFRGHLDAEPSFVTTNRGGDGFAELAEAILSARSSGSAGA